MSKAKKSVPKPPSPSPGAALSPEFVRRIQHLRELAAKHSDYPAGCRQAVDAVVKAMKTQKLFEACGNKCEAGKLLFDCQVAGSFDLRAIYRGSPKHKNRPAQGDKGTLCPEWTHAPLGSDVERHPWTDSLAAELFQQAVQNQWTLDGRTFYATKDGVPFAARSTNDGSYHGYPIAWEQIPSEIKDLWLDQGLVKRRDLRSVISRSDLENDISHYLLKKSGDR